MYFSRNHFGRHPGHGAGSLTDEADVRLGWFILLEGLAKNCHRTNETGWKIGPRQVVVYVRQAESFTRAYHVPRMKTCDCLGCSSGSTAANNNGSSNLSSAIQTNQRYP